MSAARPPKKSETIEVRLPHPTKLAFMQKARSQGRAASDIVRQQIDTYLSVPAEPAAPSQSAPPRGRHWRRPLAVLALLPALVAGIVALSGATAPAGAQPELKLAFAALDVDADGRVSRNEFVMPARAHEIDLRGAQSGLGEPMLVGSAPASTAYVRYMLSAPGGDLPLLIAVDRPQSGISGGEQLPGLVGKAFDRLDRNGDGLLSEDEFLRR